MSVPTFTVFTDLFRVIDKDTAAFATSEAGKVISAVTPVVDACLVVSYMITGVMASLGYVNQPLLEMMKRMFYTGLIASVATAGGFYQTDLIAVIQQTPAELAYATSVNFGSAPHLASTNLGTVFDSDMTSMLSVIADAFSQVGLSAKGLGMLVYAIIMIVATAIVFGVAGALMIVASISLAILAGFGPLFILALLFKSVAKFFERWMEAVVTTGLTIVLLSIAISFCLYEFSSFVGKTKLDGSGNFAYQLIGALILAVVSVVLVFEMKDIARALGGGVSAGIGGVVNAATTAARLGFMGGGGAAKAAEKAAEKGAEKGASNSIRKAAASGLFKGN